MRVPAPIANQAAPQTLEGAMLNKIKQVQEIEGQAAVDLIESASAVKPASPPETGRMVDRYA